jgi:predicted PurR-regulated permease PerM
MTETVPSRFNAYRRMVLLAFALTLVILVVWYTWEVLLLTFAGILMATILVAITEWVQAKTNLGPRLSYTIVIVGLSAIVGIAIWALAPRAIAQMGQISDVVPKSVDQARAYLNESDWGRYVAHTAERALGRIDIGAKVGAAAGILMEAVAGLVVVVVVGFFVAVEPETYEQGFLERFPENKRRRARAILRAVGSALRWWLIGQIVPMIVLGIGTMIGLWIMGIPLAFTLGLLTAIMLFVPYVGSVLSSIPALLVALMQGPVKMLWVAVLYLMVHLLEGYVVTPISQKRAVRLPPALTIVAQLAMWTLAGLLGVALATPLTAAVLVIVKMLYLKEPEDSVS